MKVIRFALLAVLAVSMIQSAELAKKNGLTLEVAKQIAAAAEKHAEQNGWKVVIAILDDGGNLVYLQREDGVQIGSIEVAIRKAETSVNFKRKSSAFAERLSGGATGLVGLPGALPFAGGVPIMHKGELIGAVGVSGVTAAQDEQIAQAGADALPRVVK